MINVHCVLSQSDILNLKVKVETKEGTIGDILNEISTNGGFIFSYGQDIPQDSVVILKYTKQTVSQFLEELFGKNIYCVEYGNKLIIRRKPLSQKVYSVQGKVVDAVTRESIPGVNVFIPGTTPQVGTVSNKDGFFRIDVPDGDNLVRLSCMGYKSHSLIPGRSKDTNVELNPENHELREVKIVCYKKLKEEKRNNAISLISAKVLENTPFNGIEHALQGNSPGVYVVRNSGMPGASLQVKIRGMNSLINSDPVYYLDGIPLQKNSLYAFSPNDIESLEILKDASGTAKYGITAANGVILLNSKNAKSKGITVAFDYYIGRQQLWKTIDLMTKSEFFDHFEEIWSDPRYNISNYDIYDTLNSLQTNWLDETFHAAKTEDCYLSVSGGNKKSDFYFSSEYYNQESIIKELSLTRYSVKLNSSHLINPKIKIGQNISFACLNFTGLHEGCFLNGDYNPVVEGMTLPPFIPGEDTAGFWTSLIIPTDFVELTNNAKQNYSLFTTLHSQIDLFPKIRYLTRLGFETYYQDNTSFTHIKISEADIIESLTPAAVSSTQNIVGFSYKILDLSFDWQHTVEYTANLPAEYSMIILAGFEFGRNKNTWNPVAQKKYDNSFNLIEDTQDASDNSFGKSASSTDYIHRAYMASLQYAYKNRYQLEVLARKDVVGFYSDGRLLKLSEIYPSLSLGWIFTKEVFFSSQRLSYGKIRYGWGKAGNSPRLNYSFYAKMMRDMDYMYAFTGDITTYTYSQRQINEKFYLENICSNNVGLDLGLFENKLFFSVEYFKNHLYQGRKYQFDNAEGIIKEIMQSDRFGIVESPLAEITNQGFEWEISLRHAGRLKSEFSLNFTHIRNQIIDVEAGANSNIEYNSNYDPVLINLPGETAGSFFGYKIERLFREEDCQGPDTYVINQPYTLDENGKKIYAQPEAKAGDYKFMDINNDGVIDKKDRTIIGNPFPDFTFGAFYNLQFWKIDFSILWQGTFGNEIFNATRLWLYNTYGLYNCARDITRSYRSPVWESGELTDEGNTNNNLHRIDFDESNDNLRISDFYIEDGSYLRLKNIQLGYTLSPEFTKRFHIQKFRIYVCAQNLLTFTNYSGLDPEVGGWGIDCGIYPQPRTYLAGLNVVF